MARDLLLFVRMSKSSILAMVVFGVGLLAFLALVTSGLPLSSDAGPPGVDRKSVATHVEIEPGTWIAYEELPAPPR